MSSKDDNLDKLIIIHKIYNIVRDGLLTNTEKIVGRRNYIFAKNKKIIIMF